MSSRAKAICETSLPDRWMAEICYFDCRKEIVTFEEIEDLDEIIERGPDWNTIEKIEITLNRPTLPNGEHG